MAKLERVVKQKRRLVMMMIIISLFCAVNATVGP